MIAAHLDKVRSQSAPFSSISGQDSTDCLKGLQYLQKQNLHTKGLLLDLLVWVVCLEFPTGHAQILAVYPQSVLYHPITFDYALVPVLGAFRCSCGRRWSPLFSCDDIGFLLNIKGVSTQKVSIALICGTMIQAVIKHFIRCGHLSTFLRILLGFYSGM